MNLETRIGKVRLKNPVLVASGTFGHAKEFEKFIDLRKLGGIVTKTITVKPRLGNPPQRIVETPSGMLNAIGLQNPGVDKFIEDKLPYLRSLKVPLFVSAMGYSISEFEAVIRRLEDERGIDGYELNLSCPNVSYGAGSGDTQVKMFAHDDRMIADVVCAVRKLTKRVVVAKLGPDVSDIGRMAQAAETAGADAISLINTFIAMAIDAKKRRPVLANRTGGLSGPCIKPIALRLVWEAARKTKIPVVGIGGILSGTDAVEFLLAGASAVQVGTANFMNPSASAEVLAGIRRYMEEEKVKDLSELIGALRA
jgi:dihydroorotate dehydrogenase (NAD+) catalytic subunit